MKQFFKPFALIIYFVVAVLSDSLGQKMKYKDLFPLLENGDYAQGGALLRQYLNDPKNAQQPSACLQMAHYYEYLSKGVDPLRETNQHLKYLDSTLNFLSRSESLITEKSLKKYDKYFQAYNRRDLRTGKFGVKLDHIHNDIEKRKSRLETRKVAVTTLKKHHQAFVRNYQEASKTYQQLVTDYVEPVRFQLTANDDALQATAQIEKSYDSANTSFDLYVKSLRQLGKEEAKLPTYEAQPIAQFGRDGLTETDFYNDAVVVWDYQAWAKAAVDYINDEVLPQKTELIKLRKRFDELEKQLAQANKLEKIRAVQPLTAAVERDAAVLANKWQPYGPSGFVSWYFTARKNYLNWYIKDLTHQAQSDSTNVYYHLDAARQLQSIATRQDSVAQAWQARDMNEDAQRYTWLFESDVASLKKFGEKQIALVDLLAQKANKTLQKWEEVSQWAVFGNDTIPLKMTTNPNQRYKPCYNDTLSSTHIYSSGLYLDDGKEPQAYLVMVPPSRRAYARVTFEASEKVFLPEKVSMIQSLSYLDSLDGYYVLHYLISPQGSSTMAVGQLTKVSMGDQHLWSKVVSMRGTPSTITKRETGELAILYNENEDSLSGDNEQKPTMFVVGNKGVLKGEQ